MYLIKLEHTKQLILLTGFVVIFALSCKKDSTTTVVTTKTIEQLLTQKTWKADEVRVQLSNNTTVYYKRGSSGTVYDSDSIKFSTNNTGIYYFSGAQYTTTWNLTNSEKSKMTLVINYPSPITIYLENIQLTETLFRYAQYCSSCSVSYLSSATRLPN